MKSVYYHFRILLLVLLFVSCSKDDESLPMFDFGTAEFEEPFCGILSTKPSILIQSLDYPPFKWFAPDTVRLIKSLEIEFNEDCLRSKSEATLLFRGKDNTAINGIQLYKGDTACPDGKLLIKSDEKNQILDLSLSISPALKDSLVYGVILVNGFELDEVNDNLIVEEASIIGEWKAKQEIGWPVCLWLLWFIAFILILAVTCLILYYLVLGVCYVFKMMIRNIPNISWQKTAKIKKKNNIRFQQEEKKNRNKQEKQEEKEEESWRKRVQLQTGWSDAIIMALRSEEEANIYISAGLQEKLVKGRPALTNPAIVGRDFNCRKEWLKEKFSDYDRWKDYNNADLMGEGYPPRDDNGDPFELHHIGQRQDSPYAELTWAQHHAGGNFQVLHIFDDSLIERQLFAKEKSDYWMERFKDFKNNSY